MRNYDKTQTPLEKRRAPKGSVVGEGRFPHTAESLSRVEALRARWGLSDAETYRRALEVAEKCNCQASHVESAAVPDGHRTSATPAQESCAVPEGDRPVHAAGETCTAPEGAPPVHPDGLPSEHDARPEESDALAPSSPKRAAERLEAIGGLNLSRSALEGIRAFAREHRLSEHAVMAGVLERWANEQVRDEQAAPVSDWTKVRHACPRCGREGPVDPDFGVVNRRGVPKGQSWCKSCRSTTSYYHAPRKNRVRELASSPPEKER